jgi:type VI secretion system secreted protein Hcp
MEKIIVSNVSFGGGGGDLPTETVALAYGKVTYNYIPQKSADGTADGVQPVYHDLMIGEVG